MFDRRAQGIGLLALSAGLSLFLMVHAALVSVDFEACFGNFAASINGERLYLRVGDMSLGALVLAAGRQFSWDQPIVAVVGLLPLSPFAVAWSVSRTNRARLFWVVAAFVGLVCVVAGVSTRNLGAFHDCDRNGVGVEILVAPLVYAAINLMVVLVLVALRFLALRWRESRPRPE